MKKNILLNDEFVVIDILESSNEGMSFIYQDKKYSFRKEDMAKKVVSAAPSFVVNGREIKVELKNNSRTKKNVSDHGLMISPMPGKILKIFVELGAEVVAGTPLLVMEAMKMEHTIKAAKTGVIAKIHFQENAQVAAGVELVTIC